MANPVKSAIRIKRGDRTKVQFLFNIPVAYASGDTDPSILKGITFTKNTVGSLSMSSGAIVSGNLEITMSRAIAQDEVLTFSMDNTNDLYDASGAFPADRATAFTAQASSPVHEIFIGTGYFNSARTSIQLQLLSDVEATRFLLQSGGLTLTNLSGAFTVAGTGGPTVSSVTQVGDKINIVLSGAVADGTNPTVAASTIASVNGNEAQANLNTWSTLTVRNYADLGNNKKRRYGMIRTGIGV